MGTPAFPMDEIYQLGGLVDGERVEAEIGLFEELLTKLLSFAEWARKVDHDSSPTECSALVDLENILNCPMGKRVVRDDGLQAEVHRLLELIY